MHDTIIPLHNVIIIPPHVEEQRIAQEHERLRRIGDLIGDLAALSTASHGCVGRYTLDDLDDDDVADLAGADLETLLERLLGARFTNNRRDAHLLHLAVLEPENMSDEERQAAAAFAPFLAFAAPLIVAGYELERAFDNALHPHEADKGDAWRLHFYVLALRDALGRTVTALAGLIADLTAGRVTLPPFLEGDALIAAEAEHAAASAPRFTSPPFLRLV